MAHGFDEKVWSPYILTWRRAMAENEIEVFETTAGQVADVLERLGVPKERMITIMIEPDWLTKARRASRRLVIAAGLSDDDIDRMIKEAQKEVEPLLG
jgi:hypothetical protein